VSYLRGEKKVSGKARKKEKAPLQTSSSRRLCDARPYAEEKNGKGGGGGKKEIIAIERGRGGRVTGNPISTLLSEGKSMEKGGGGGGGNSGGSVCKDDPGLSPLYLLLFLAALLSHAKGGREEKIGVRYGEGPCVCFFLLGFRYLKKGKRERGFREKGAPKMSRPLWGRCCIYAVGEGAVVHEGKKKKKGITVRGLLGSICVRQREGAQRRGEGGAQDCLTKN